MKNKRLYPPRWREIANRIKEKANYTCQHCKNKHKPPKVILTVHHRDGDPTNNADTNLIALCRKCHLREQTKLQPYLRKYTQEKLGQTSFVTLKPPSNQ